MFEKNMNFLWLHYHRLLQHRGWNWAVWKRVLTCRPKIPNPTRTHFFVCVLCNLNGNSWFGLIWVSISEWYLKISRGWNHSRSKQRTDQMVLALSLTLKFLAPQKLVFPHKKYFPIFLLTFVTFILFTFLVWTTV